MTIDLTPLISNIAESLDINSKISMPEDFYKGTDIRKLSELEVVGSISDIGDRIYNLRVNVSGNMTLPCALSLEDVEYPFSLNIIQNYGSTDDFEQNYKIMSNTLDILPILWENIVLEIPNRVVKENVVINTKGDGWSLVNDGEIKNNQLSELKELLDMEEKK